MFCGVLVSQSFSGFQLSVKAMRPSFSRAAVNGLPANSPDAPAVVGDLGPQRVLLVRGEALHSRLEGNLPPADRGIHLHVRDARPRRLADQPNVAAQPAPLHFTCDFFAAAVSLWQRHDLLQRQRDDEQTERVRAAGAALRGQVHLAAGEPYLAGLIAVHVNGGHGIDVLGGQRNPAARPFARE